MTIAILPDIDTPIKTLKCNGLDRLSGSEPVGVGSDGDAEHTSERSSIVIRVGLAGICSVQILADSSTDEEELREWLTAVSPVLESMSRGRRSTPNLSK